MFGGGVACVQLAPLSGRWSSHPLKPEVFTASMTASWRPFFRHTFVPHVTQPCAANDGCR
jgi:hypothetical protein